MKKVKCGQKACVCFKVNSQTTSSAVTVWLVRVSVSLPDCNSGRYGSQARMRVHVRVRHKIE